MHKSAFFGVLSQTKIRSVLVAATALLMAGCSSTIERFQSAYNNPSDADPVYTASVPKPQKTSFRKPVVQEPAYSADETIDETPIRRAQPVADALAPKSYDYSKQYKPAYKQVRLVPPPAAKKPRLIPAPDLQDQAAAEPAAGTVRVGSGMTLASIARQNGVSVPDLIAANNLQSPYRVRQGQVLLLPEGATAMAKPRLVQPAQPEEQVADATPVPKPIRKRVRLEQDVADVPTPTVAPTARKTITTPKDGKTYVVASGDTLYSLGRKFGMKPSAIADANGLAYDTALPAGTEIKIPAAKAATTVAIAETPKTSKAPNKKAPLALTEEEQANAEPAVGEENSTPVAAAPVKVKEPVVTPVQSASAPSLRWPVKGKVILGYGPKADGLKNEGINIAVPEGTSIRAADDGVVAYSGNELKGYGNLVLIRHAGGYVTAYAHAKQLMVKRGDTVKRGDVIGLAGQTGAVTSPQLHFEVRKGAAALDPMKYIGNSTASN